MKISLGASVLCVSIAMAACAVAQTTTGPDQPVQPQVPTLVPRAPQQRPQPPFTLTPEEETQVDRVLNMWEKRNNDVKTFDCRFKRWTYDLVFSPPRPNQPPQPKFIDVGVIKYASPDRGLFCVETTELDGKEVAVDAARTEHWISDGKSIFEFNPGKKQLIEHKLPPELQGKAIADSPLPFLFGAEAQKLKQRYFIRLVTPRDVRNQIWLESYPRHQQDAANFHHALFVISTPRMEPHALKITQPNQKDYMAYQFFEIVINNPLRLFQGDPFRPFTPPGWQKLVEEPPAGAPAQARRPPNDGQR